jgi:hypothetical protein
MKIRPVVREAKTNAVHESRWITHRKNRAAR